MIHTFADLKEFARTHIGSRYPQLSGGVDAFAVDFETVEAEEVDLVESWQSPAASAVEPTPVPSDPVTNEHSSETDFLLCLNAGLRPDDIVMLASYGVRPKDAHNAGLRHLSSSEAAFSLDRVDNGSFEGILIPYQSDIKHCRVIFDEPATLFGKNKGRVVSILQPTRSTNHLYFPPGTTEELIADSKNPVIITDSELSALAAIQLNDETNGTKFLPVGLGGPWAWRMSRPIEDRDAGETKIEKGPVEGLKERIGLDGRVVIVAFDSGTSDDNAAAAGRIALAKLLRKQKSLVSTFEVPSRSDGSRQTFGQWIASVGAAAAREAIEQLVVSSTSTTRGYLVNEDGIYFIDQKSGPVFLSSPFKVIAATREIGSTNWGRYIEIVTSDASTHQVNIPLSELADGGTALAQVLLVLGVRVNPNRIAKERLALWLQLQNPQSIFITSRVGWHEGSFILPERTISPAGAEVTVYHGGLGDSHRYHERGTLEDWRKEIGSLCVGNSRLTFAVALAFVGPLLKVIDQEPGGFHYRALSSTGKTTALVCAGSVWGGGPKGFTQTWRATSNGLEAVAEVSNDTFLCLDEIGQVSPDETGRVAYMLAIGQGKVRMTKEIRVRPPKIWNVVFLSTGEVSLADHMMTAGQQVRAGQEVRLVDIPADASKGMGIFEDIHDSTSADQFANRLTSAAAQCYGTPSIAFLDQLVRDRDHVAVAARGFIARFLETHVSSKAAGEISRAARRFALVAFAGEYASSLHITGWPEGEAMKAASTCFRAWLDRRGSIGAGDMESGIAQVRLFLTLNGTSRFETICMDDQSKVEKSFTRDRVGFREEIVEEGTISASGAASEDEPENTLFVYYVLPATFRREVCKGFDADMVAKALRDRGHIEANERGRLTFQKRLPGMGRQRVYRILPTIFAEYAGDTGTDGAR